MRGAALVVLAAVLAGCTSGFPSGSQVVTELEVGAVAAGERVVHDFPLPTDAGVVVVGFRVGRAEHVHVLLRGPDGAAYDSHAGAPEQPCAVRAARGAWALEVWPDPFDGNLSGGKFTVRTAAEAPPALFPCADDAFPGRGRNVTLAMWDLNLTPGEAFDATFEQPYDLDLLRAAWRGNASNVTVLVTPPGGEAARPENLAAAPARGAWQLRVELPPEALPLLNATLALQGVGR